MFFRNIIEKVPSQFFQYYIVLRSILQEKLKILELSTPKIDPFPY